MVMTGCLPAGTFVFAGKSEVEARKCSLSDIKNLIKTNLKKLALSEKEGGTGQSTVKRPD